MQSIPLRNKWLVGCVAFCLIGAIATAILLWSARGRTTAQGPASDAPTEQEVAFEAGGNTVTGVLVLPPGKGPHPAIVFINGSGNADRTGNGMFPALWQKFARRGFACLSWDRPGVRGSSGDFETQSFPDRAAEALAAVRFLRARTDIRSDRLGLWGFSQGGTVAPLAAAEVGNVAFVVAVSGCQTPAWQQDLYRVEAELRADGFSEKDIAKAGEIARLRMDLMRGTGIFEELDETQKTCLGRPWFEYVHYCDRKRFESGQLMVNFDPAESWEKIQCPVLAVFGDKDTSCPVEASAAVIRQSLEKAKNSDLTIKVFSKAGHQITVTESGGRKEAEQRAKSRPPEQGLDFAPGFVDFMSDWLVARFGPNQ